MSRNGKLLIIVVLLVAIVGAVALRAINGSQPLEQDTANALDASPMPQPAKPAPAPPEPAMPEAEQKPSSPEDPDNLPRLVDFGADNCVPCRQMMPILGEIAKDYKGSLIVEVVNVYEDTQRASEHNVRMIPTQIFFDSAGEELYRHIGFMSREDILAKWAELGVDLDTDSPPGASE